MTPLSAPRIQTSLGAISTSFAQSYVKAGNLVMDVGCGDGMFTIELAKMVGINGKVYAIDSDSAQLKKAKENANAAGITNIIFLQKDINNLLYEKPDLVGSFDVVHFRSLLKEQLDPEATIRNMLSFLKLKTEQQLLAEGKTPFQHFLARDGTLLIEEFGDTNYSLPGARPFSKIVLACHSLATKAFSLFKCSSLKKALQFDRCKEKVVSKVALCSEEEKTTFAQAMKSTSSANELEKIAKQPKASIMHREFIQIAL